MDEENFLRVLAVQLHVPSQNQLDLSKLDCDKLSVEQQCQEKAWMEKCIYLTQ